MAGYSAAIACDFSELFSQRVPAVFGGLFSSDCLWSSASYFGSDYQCFSANYSAAIACGLQRTFQQQLPVVFSELFSSDYLWSSVITCERLPAICQQAIQVYIQFWFSAAVEELSQGRLHQFDLDFIDCGSGFLLLLINCGLISLACCGLLLCLLWILVLDFVLLSSSG